MQFSLSLRQGRTLPLGETGMGARQVKLGEALDLGDIRVKPARTHFGHM